MLLIFLISIISMWLSVFFPQLLLGINQGIFADKLYETESVSIRFFFFPSKPAVYFESWIPGGGGHIEILIHTEFEENKIPCGVKQMLGDIFSQQLYLEEKLGVVKNLNKRPTSR